MPRRNIKSVISPRDKDLLDATGGSNWIPQDPAEVVSGYVNEKEVKPEDNSLEDRRAKAKQVYDGYGKIIDKCEKLKSQIAERCKNVVVDLNEAEHLAIIESVRRVFGTDGKKITFQMYQRCIEELAKSSDAEIPRPGENI